MTAEPFLTVLYVVGNCATSIQLCCSLFLLREMEDQGVDIASFTCTSNGLDRPSKSQCTVMVSKGTPSESGKEMDRGLQF